MSFACVTAAFQPPFLADMEQFIIGFEKSKRSTGNVWSCSNAEDSITYLVTCWGIKLKGADNS